MGKHIFLARLNRNASSPRLYKYNQMGRQVTRMETVQASKDFSKENSEKDFKDSSAEEPTAYLLCRTPSFDCRIDRAVCVEGKAVGEYESKNEALEALRDEWERGTCF